MNLKTLLIVATILLPTTVFAKDLEIPIPCAPTAIVPPPSLTRVQGDGDIWNFKLVAAPNSNVTFSKQDWSFNTQNPVAEPNNPDNPAGPGLIANWGRFGGGDGTNSLSWDAPNESGTFTVSVHAKRHCEGGGGGGAGGAAVDEDFDASWTTTVVKIDHIEVDSGGTALPDGPNTPDKTDICAAVKAPGGYVILKAVLTPQIAEADLPINAIIWTGGGQAVPNSKLKWRVPKTVAKKYSITATVGNTSYTMLSFVVWAEATEGWFSTTQFPNYKSPNNNQIPTYPDGLGGPEPDGSFASWCEMRFTIAPHDLIQDGIDGIVMKDSFDWDVERLKKVKYWRKSVANNLWSYAKNQSHSWELDTYPSDRRDRNPWDDTGEGNIYGADRPGLGGALELIGQYRWIGKVNMAEYATVAFAGGGEPEQCSDFMPWHAFRANKIDYDDPNHPWVKDTDWENEIKVGNVWWGLAPFSVEILATTLPNGVREQFYRTPALTARGGKAPYQWSVDGGALPPGLRLDETSGIIEGVPTTAGQYKFLVVAWDFTFPAISADADDAEYTIIISPN